MSEVDLDLLRTWEGREERREDTISLAPVQMLAATLDRDPTAFSDGEILPPLYHWLFFPSLTMSADLARDGHERLGEFMPPVPFPRRMFAGARMEYRGVLRIGQRVERIARIESVRFTEGRSGPLVFVTVAYELRDAEGLKIVEEQDIAYRPATGSKTNTPERDNAPRSADFSREIVPDERLLFRFSALTFNAHRIHYDLPYAQGEGYPALVIHGPLTAVLLADLVIHETGRAALERFSFRARSAFFLGERMTLCGKYDARSVELAAVAESGVVGLTANAGL